MDYLVELDSDAAVRTLKPDMRLLSTLPVRGVIVTALPPTRNTISSPASSPPPPASTKTPPPAPPTAASRPTGPRSSTSRTMLAYQASPRGGIVRVTVNADRVLLEGQAVTVVRGQMSTPPDAGV